MVLLWTIIRLIFVLARERVTLLWVVVLSAEEDGIPISRPPMFSRVVGVFSRSEELAILVSEQLH